MISRVPIWSQNLKLVRLKQQQIRPLHIPHRSDSNAFTQQDRISFKVSKNWKIIYISNRFIVFLDVKSQKSTYIYDCESYMIHSKTRIYEMCVQCFDRIYLLTIGKCKRYQIQQFDANTHKFTVLKVDGMKPLSKPDCTCFMNTKNSSIVIFGSKLAHQFQITSMLWRFDLKMNRWDQLDDSQMQTIFRQNQVEKSSMVLNLEKKQSKTIQNKCSILTENLLYIFDEKTIIIYGFLQQKVLNSYRLKISSPVQSIVHQVKQDGSVIVCINNSNLIILESDKLPKYINIGIFLDNIPKSFSAVKFYGKDLRLYGQIQAEPCQQPSFISIRNWNVQFNDLKQLNRPESEAQNYQNVPLSFYFNKKMFGDLILVVQNRQIYCSRTLIEFYSSKVKKLLLQSSSKSKKEGQVTATTLKIDNVRYPTMYFLIQQLYNNFILKTNFDHETFLQLLQLSNKFQIKQMQAICEENIPIADQILLDLIQFYQKTQTTSLKERLLLHLINNFHDVSHKVPIAKLEDLIRSLYIPKCHHDNFFDLKTHISNYYVIRKNQGIEQRFDRRENIQGLVEGGNVIVQICEKCSKVIGFDGIKRTRSQKHGYKYS